MTPSSIDATIDPTAHGAPMKPATAEAAFPSALYGWSMVVLLGVALLFKSIDRNVISILIDDIKADLQISDTQIGLLQGLAVALLYSFLGIVLGRMADLFNRTKVIAVGVAFWSTMNALCGLAAGFWQFFAARVGVAVGEATLGPAASSLVTDCFPKEKLPRAYAFYFGIGALGLGLGSVLTGFAYDLAGWLVARDVPLIGDMARWQVVFILVGLPGVLLGFLFLIIGEPARRQPPGYDPKVRDDRKFSEFTAHLKAHKGAYGGLMLSFSLAAACSQILIVWFAAAVMRTWGWSPSETGKWIGFSLMFAIPISVFVGGAILEYWLKKKRYECFAWMGLIACAGMGSFGILAMLMPTPELAITFAALAMVFNGLPAAAGLTSFNLITPNRMRGQVTGLFYFLVNVIGTVLGTMALPLVTDYVFGDPAMVRWSIVIGLAVVMPVGILVSLAAIKPYLASYRAINESGRAA